MRDSPPLAVASMNDAVAREELLLEFLRHLEPRKDGQRSAHVALSRLSALSRRQSHLRVASEGLDRLAKSGKGQLFHLANDDLLFFHDASTETVVRAELSRLRLLFADDPLMRDIEDATAFGQVYDLADAFGTVVRLVRGDALRDGTTQLSDAPGDNGIKERLKQRRHQGHPLPSELLPKLEAALVSTDLSSFIRRHPVCRLPAGGAPEQVFTDLAISLQALSEAIVPTFDLAADRCVARYLAEALDRRILAMLLRQEPRAQRGTIAIPLTVATLVSATFRSFDDQLSMNRRGSIVLKIGVTDILSDPDAARFVFGLARHRGYRILISGTTPLTLPLLTFEGFGIDFVRCECTPFHIVDATLADRLGAASRRMAPARLVVDGICSHDALALALAIEAGIELFQGRYVEQAPADGRWRRRP